MIHQSWGTLESGDEHTCEVTVYSTSLTSIARWMYAFGADFTVIEPAELRVELGAVADYHDQVAERYRRAMTARP